MDEARRKEIVLDAADITVVASGTMSNGPLQDEPWWKDWQNVRASIEAPLRSALSVSETRAEIAEAHIGRLREALGKIIATVEETDEFGHTTIYPVYGRESCAVIADEALLSTPTQSAARLRALEKVAEALPSLLRAFVDCRPKDDPYAVYDPKDAGIVALLDLEGLWYWEEELQAVVAALSALAAIERGEEK